MISLCVKDNFIDKILFSVKIEHQRKYMREFIKKRKLYVVKRIE